MLQYTLCRIEGVALTAGGLQGRATSGEAVVS